MIAPEGREILADRCKLWQNSGARLGVFHVLAENLLLQKLFSFRFASLPFSFRVFPFLACCGWGADVPSRTSADHAAVDAHD
jgi:hypothetical protein